MVFSFFFLNVCTDKQESLASLEYSWTAFMVCSLQKSRSLDLDAAFDDEEEELWVFIKKSILNLTSKKGKQASGLYLNIVQSN